MYIINITVNPDLPAEQHEKMFIEHSEWFKKYFQAGKFLMLSPYTDTDAHAGVIFAHTDSREEFAVDFGRRLLLPQFRKIRNPRICTQIDFYQIARVGRQIKQRPSERLSDGLFSFSKIREISKSFYKSSSKPKRLFYPNHLYSKITSSISSSPI
jgi:hypothetical protein